MGGRSAISAFTVRLAKLAVAYAGCQVLTVFGLVKFWLLNVGDIRVC